MIGKPSLRVETIAFHGAVSKASRVVAAEVPIALIYDGGTEAVMMASPCDLEDFALGFSLNDHIISNREDLIGLDIVEVDRGIELRIALASGVREGLVTRRRLRAGPVGCGLCGVESITEALRPLPVIGSAVTLSSDEIVQAMIDMTIMQALNAQTRAVHAAAFYISGQGVVLVREDVGRHNALDKLAGALSRSGLQARDGAILITSRVSVEIVQKAAMMGAPIIAAISAPTSLALEEATAVGITVVGIVRDDGLDVFTHGGRINHGT